jgi:hypothetical protein
VVPRPAGRYGSRRIAWELRNRGMAVNSKRVVRTGVSAEKFTSNCYYLITDFPWLGHVFLTRAGGF